MLHHSLTIFRVPFSIIDNSGPGVIRNYNFGASFDNRQIGTVHCRKTIFRPGVIVSCRPGPMVTINYIPAMVLKIECSGPGSFSNLNYGLGWWWRAFRDCAVPLTIFRPPICITQLSGPGCVFFPTFPWFFRVGVTGC